jgi:UDP-N-acetyl-2-amino-2-deoxyglucuronate dehydrogenase
MKNFALTGAAGYIAPRHLRAIRDTGNRLIAALDPHDAVGVIDRYFDDVAYFKEFERFDRFVEKLRRKRSAERIDYVSICAPNYLHDAHIRFALRVGADAICEKPLVLNPWNLDALAELEQETGRRVLNVLQLRLHPDVLALQERCDRQRCGAPLAVDLTYVVPRGAWYGVSWKGDVEKSGGITTNIGVHFFDVLLWLFGPVHELQVHLREPRRAAGLLCLGRATVRWFLSLDKSDLTDAQRASGATAFRSLLVDGEQTDLSAAAAELHTASYREILAGRGFGIEQARPSIDLVHKLRSAPVERGSPEHVHPLARSSA